MQTRWIFFVFLLFVHKMNYWYCPCPYYFIDNIFSNSGFGIMKEEAFL